MNSSSTPARRTKLMLDVSFKPAYSRTESPGTLKNISATGAFLEYDGPKPKDPERLFLTLSISGNQRTLLAQVIWLSEHGYGLKFLPKNGRDLRIIDDIIECADDLWAGKRTCMKDVLKKIA